MTFIIIDKSPTEDFVDKNNCLKINKLFRFLKDKFSYCYSVPFVNLSKHF